ncbi:MAG: Hpt domain-containing protein [Bdellovibrionales bacterium]|nr:Hpt domain-containing protein [Bdellovibrionales bacterium]
MSSKKLSRQLKRVFGDKSIENRLSAFRSVLSGEATAEIKAELELFLIRFPDFLQTVDESYMRLDDKAEGNGGLIDLNHTLDAMMNSLGQGFFLFGPDGICHSVCSQVCADLLEAMPSGRAVAEVLRVPDAELDTFKEWCTLLFGERVGFESLIDIAPAVFPHSSGRAIELSYRAVRDTSGRLTQVLVIATDYTDEARAKQETSRLQGYVTLVMQVLKNKTELKRFIAAARSLLDEALKHANSPHFGIEDINAIRRGIHTIKGATSSFGFRQLKDDIHEVESHIENLTGLAEAQNYLLQGVTQLRERFESILSEHREILREVIGDTRPTREIDLQDLMAFAHRLEPNPTLRKEFEEQFVATPLWRILEGFNLTVQSIAEDMKKPIAALVFEGRNVPVVHELYAGVFASLSHVFVNMVDHGIEAPKIRRKRGKSMLGRISVKSDLRESQGRRYLHMWISDDGNGIDVQAVAAKAESQGIDTTDLPEQEIMNLIFAPGFSTATEVTELSGRGIGLEALRVSVELRGGSITVSSVPEQSTTFHIVLPYSTSGELDAAAKAA